MANATKQRRRFAAAALALGLALGAAAASSANLPAAEPLELRYALHRAGLRVGNLALSVMPEGAVIRSELVMRGQGLVQWVSGSFARMVTTTRAVQPRGIRPVAYDAVYSKWDRTREIEIRWDESGRVARATVATQGREPRPSEVPAELQAATVDPLTALARLRDWLAAPDRATGDDITVAVFDARKRLDLEARVLPEGTARLDGRRLPVRRLEVRLVPRAGYDEDDWFVSWPGRPQIWFEVLVSDDGRFAPLAVRRDGAPVVELTADCTREAGRCEPL
jgi:hypothetical protein